MDAAGALVLGNGELSTVFILRKALVIFAFAWLFQACSGNGAEPVETATADDAQPAVMEENGSTADAEGQPGTERDAGNGQADVVEEIVPLEPADVSFLIPLRSVDDFGAGAMGGFGALLPRAHFDQLDSLTRIDEPDVLYQRLDVVGVRLDPCFVEARETENCTSHIRLVLQPVIGAAEDYVARDATVHAFYEVPRDELSAIAQSLAKLRIGENGETEIGQHPVADTAAELLLPALGADRLSRITFVSVHASDEAWSFGGFDVVNGTLTHHELVGVDDHEQHLTSLGGTETLDASILPEPLIETEAARFMELFLRDEMSSEETESAHAGLRRLLDPAVHDTGTVDCASCHMATASAYFIEGHLGLTIPDVYVNTQNQRMFGYFGIEQSISPRVNAETSLVLDAFERLQ